MALVKILIKGIAMSYHKDDGLWRVLFPIGDCHKIKFTKDGSGTGMALAKKNRRIRIRTEGAKSEFAAGDKYDEFLDLTADYSHNDGVTAKSGWANLAVLMTIENAKFSVDGMTNIDHFMLHEDIVTRSPKRIGYDGILEIDAEKVIVEVDGHSKFPQTFTKDVTLTFDNDCGMFDPRKSSDFDMLYNVVDDPNNVGKRFVMAKVTDQMKGLFMAGTKLDNDAQRKVKDSLAFGLPCHKVRVSKPGGLP